MITYLACILLLALVAQVSNCNNHTTGRPKQQPFLFIGITSAPKNYERRMSQRESWLKDISKYSSGAFPIQYRFYLAKTANNTMMSQIQNEAAQYGDIVILPWMDDYYRLTQKVFDMTKEAFTEIQAQYLLKTDDDSYVYVEKVLKLLTNRWALIKEKLAVSTTAGRNQKNRSHNNTVVKELRDPLYLGHMIHMDTVPLVEKYAIGAGYVIGSGIADFLFDKHTKFRPPFTPFEDASMGLWVQEAEQRGVPVDYVQETRIQPWTPCADRREALILHYIRPKQMRCIWQNIQTKGSSCCPNE